MMSTTVLLPRAFVEGSYRSCVKYEGHLVPEECSVSVDKMGKWPYAGDLLKAPDLVQRTLSVG